MYGALKLKLHVHRTALRRPVLATGSRQLSDRDIDVST